MGNLFRRQAWSLGGAPHRELRSGGLDVQVQGGWLWVEGQDAVFALDLREGALHRLSGLDEGWTPVALERWVAPR